MKIIKLSQNLSTKVSNEDFEFLSQWKWCASNNTKEWCTVKKIYAVRGTRKKSPSGEIKYTRIYIHRAIMERILGPENLHEMDGKVVDHGDGNTLNNTRENLWLITQAENSDWSNLKNIKNSKKIKKHLQSKRHRRKESEIKAKELK